MKLVWMDRYRSLVRSLIYYSNASAGRNKHGTFPPVEGGVCLTKMEYQILEYICEHEDENQIMTDIARALGTLQSNVTVATKKLLGEKLVERYRLGNDKKKIVLRPTDRGKRVYEQICTNYVIPVFQPFFDSLEGCSKEELEKFEYAIDQLSRRWYAFTEELHRIED